MSNLFLTASLIILILVTLLWIFSVIITNVSIIDLFWGMGFVVVNLYYFISVDEFFIRNTLLLILVSTWGIRLFTHLSFRNIGKGEDFRYQEFRRSYGAKRYWWVSFFQSFLLQGILIMIVSLPLLAAHFGTQSDKLNWLDFLGITIWLLGIMFEAGGDFQLSRFKKNPLNKGKVLDTGFWKYTRHPNYFGDAAVWWAFGIFSIAAGSYWPIIGSFIMTLLLLKISGVSLLEKTLKKDKDAYSEYIRKTSSFIPWFPKK